jgi:hypothetical protein
MPRDQQWILYRHEILSQKRIGSLSLDRDGCDKNMIKKFAAGFHLNSFHSSPSSRYHRKVVEQVEEGQGDQTSL